MIKGMNRIALIALLDRLRLSQIEAATLLSVNPRTFRRWIEDPAEMSKPAEAALLAWDRLNSLGLAWRPDGVAIGETDPAEIASQIARFRQHAIDLNELLDRVERRGGPNPEWRVDLKKNEARLGPLRVYFYRLVNDGFSPASYSRSDRHPDPERDSTLLEDAYASIAAALARDGSKAA